MRRIVKPAWVREDLEKRARYRACYLQALYLGWSSEPLEPLRPDGSFGPVRWGQLTPEMLEFHIRALQGIE